ncbi:hypothetical protein H5410_003065 [Solanum commersonii]|uniref:Uncharacterized protein n=1 Tax=Solanum commersonii TaxID=4109 RepID=A0A9J6B3Z2_SOLCO|nr:hypothetical protein H5410_003065 [Solanum commersonii]
MNLLQQYHGSVVPDRRRTELEHARRLAPKNYLTTYRPLKLYIQIGIPDQAIRSPTRWKVHMFLKRGVRS